MAQQQVIKSEKIAPPVGPYNQAIRANDMIFTAGQIGMNADGELADGISEQTRQALSNLAAVLEAAGASLADVVKTTVFLQSMEDYAAMNAVYAEVFEAAGGPFPGRSAFAVAELPKGALVEIETIAFAPVED